MAKTKVEDGGRDKEVEVVGVYFHFCWIKVLSYTEHARKKNYSPYKAT